MFARLRHWDIEILKLINIRGRLPFLDRFLPLISRPYIFLIPFAAIVLLHFWQGWLYALKASLVAGAGVALTDSFSYYIIKGNIRVRRPFEVIPGVTPLGICPRARSFPSNHAGNTAALVLAVGYFYPAYLPILIPIVLLVGYSRVYCGAHYPSDVLTGWALGLLWTSLIIKLSLTWGWI